MPRFIMTCSKGHPPQERPAGMNAIVGMNDYANARNAERFLVPGPVVLRNMRAGGYTHLGLYDSPRVGSAPDQLVKAIPL